MQLIAISLLTALLIIILFTIQANKQTKKNHFILLLCRNLFDTVAPKLGCLSLLNA